MLWKPWGFFIPDKKEMKWKKKFMLRISRLMQQHRTSATSSQTMEMPLLNSIPCRAYRLHSSFGFLTKSFPQELTFSLILPVKSRYPSISSGPLPWWVYWHSYKSKDSRVPVAEGFSLGSCPFTALWGYFINVITISHAVTFYTAQEEVVFTSKLGYNTKAFRVDKFKTLRCFESPGGFLFQTKRRWNGEKNLCCEYPV